jgi:hypothetical protein
VVGLVDRRPETFVYPMVALGVALVGTIAAEYLTEAYERQRMRDVFGSFVPDQIVDEALARATGNRLGGVERECTVMFSDLRGFTGFSERLGAEQVIEGREPLPRPDERRHPRGRGHADRLHGRRHHGAGG